MWSDKLGTIRGTDGNATLVNQSGPGGRTVSFIRTDEVFRVHILCMKLFELELTTEETAAQLKINYKTSCSTVYRNFRKLISSDLDTVH